jgi:hypothetical protein
VAAEMPFSRHFSAFLWWQFGSLRAVLWHRLGQRAPVSHSVCMNLEQILADVALISCNVWKFLFGVVGYGKFENTPRKERATE